ncbi:hypothetical protein LAZ67_10002166 [Cordylochernes scorpioides]|uniref:Uncharacterized protein n=1 Tax=Cordylochernes scorpioides TaxID=51811 RepID=A0ABY6KWD6_9ARAC|nr:hypothetical protein LAZ67_10002166 [Cordylochernes scorpioides]
MHITRIPGKSDPFKTVASIESAIYNFNPQEKSSIRNTISSTLQKSVSQKLNPREIKIINQLKRKEDLVICHSDKGSHTVVLNRTDYQTKIHDILNDTTTFCPITVPDKNGIHARFKLSLGSLKRNQIITQEEFKQFTSSASTLPFIYSLPKIHKPSVLLSQLPHITYPQLTHISSLPFNSGT